MKQLIAAAGIGAALIVSPLLTSCSDDSGYIKRLNEGGINYSSEAQAIKTAKSICKVLDEGVPVDEAIYEGSEASGYSIHDTAYIMGASIRFYCDNHKDLVS
jgi:hypothetical protein